MQAITKATNLTNKEYQHLLELTAGFRKMFLKSAKCGSWRVYTEARKNGLRSKIVLKGPYTNKDIKYGMKIIRQINDNLFKNLDITIKENQPKYRWQGEAVCIFVKYKK